MITSLKLADPQPIDSRFGEAIWLTDLITPNNPDIQLKYLELTQDSSDRIVALWRYVANLPYKETIKSKLIVDGKVIAQNDTWFYPAEIIRVVKQGNCANRSFLLTSLLLNEISPGSIYCVMGHLKLDSIGAHAWVEVDLGERYILETTQPNLEKALVPARKATAYKSLVYFDNKGVYTVEEGVDVASVLNTYFGLCQIDFLREYLCDRCLEL